MTRNHLARVLGAVAAGVLASAGGLPEARAALDWDFSLGADAYVTDNLYLDPEPSGAGDRAPVQESAFSISPEAWLEWEAPRDRANLEYTGQYLTFSGDEEIDPFWIHNLDAALSWRRWAPFFLEATESLGRAPRSQERDGVSVVDQIDSSSLSVRAGLMHEWGGRATAELAYRLNLQTFPGTDDADETLGQYGEARASYRWSPLLGGTVDLSYGNLDRDLAEDAVELRASGYIDQRVSERLALRYGLEWVRDEVSLPVGDDAPPGASETEVNSSLLKTVEVNGSFNDGTWSLAYEDTLDYLADGDTLKTGLATADVTLLARLGSSLEIGGLYRQRDFEVSGREETAWGGTVDARWMIAPWIALDLKGAWTSGTIQEVNAPEIEDRTLRAGVSCVAVLWRHLELEAGYVYRQNDSTDESRSYEANLFYAGLMYSFGEMPPGTVPASSLDDR